MLSNYLAEIWGITIVVISLAMLIKENYLRRALSLMEDDAYLFFGGVANFVIGIAMVLAHNVWVKDWQVIVTILGWIALLKALAMLFLPETTKNFARNMQSKNWLSTALVITVFIGLIITYFGFTA